MDETKVIEVKRDILAGNDLAADRFRMRRKEEGTFLLHTDIHIESLMATEDALYATSSVTPGKIYTIGYDSWAARNRTIKETYQRYI